MNNKDIVLTLTFDELENLLWDYSMGNRRLSTPTEDQLKIELKLATILEEHLCKHH